MDIFNPKVHKIHRINFRYEDGIWLFDDAEKKIKDEAMVNGMPEIMEHFTDTDRLTLLLSATKEYRGGFFQQQFSGAH